MKDAIMIVDHYQLDKDAERRNQKIDPERYAQGLSLMSRPLGLDPRRIAIVAEGDIQGVGAYQRAQFEIVTMDGNRSSDLPLFMVEMNEFIDNTYLKRLVVVSTDPTFTLLCTWASKKGVDVFVWVPRESIPSKPRDYNYQPLEEVLPDLKVPKVDIRLDYENLHFGLVDRGWSPNAKELIDSIRAEGATLGDVVNIFAYADWTVLNKSANRDVQRELALEGVETRYQVSLRGKNSVDMKIADDIASLIARDPSESESVDIVMLGTCDRDFRPTLDRAKTYGKRVVVLALENGISRLLKDVAEIRYLDHRLGLGLAIRQGGEAHPLPWDEDTEAIMRLLVWLQRKGFRWGFTDQIIAEASLGPNAVQRLHRAVDKGLLIRRTLPSANVDNGQGERETLMPNQAHPWVQAESYILRWLPGRVRYCLREKESPMPYVDSNFLANGMVRDATLQRIGLGQERREAEGWLDLAAKVGILVKKTQPNPKAPKRTIHTWWLPGTEEIVHNNEKAEAVTRSNENTGLERKNSVGRVDERIALPLPTIQPRNQTIQVSNKQRESRRPFTMPVHPAS